MVTFHSACLVCTDVRGNPNATEGAGTLRKGPLFFAFGGVETAVRSEVDPKPPPFFSPNKNDGPRLVEKPGGDPRLDIPVRHGLLDFRQQSVAGAPGGCECVARRSVEQHRQIASPLFM